MAKSLRLERLSLLSIRERTGLSLPLHPKLTIFLGSNNTGKSSIIKSIYSAFGADPSKTSEDWIHAEVKIRLDFLIEGKNYAIIRDRDFFVLLHANQIIGKFRSITKELSPAIAGLLGIKLKLSDRTGNNIIPTPAFLFLPYYIDQDSGWNAVWGSFGGTSQFSNGVSPALEYHFGIRSPKYYELKGDLEYRKIYKEKKALEIEALKQARSRFEDVIGEITYSIDLDHFKDEIDRLLKECQGLKTVQDGYRAEITELSNDRTILKNQIAIAEHSLRELSLDYEYATEVAPLGDVVCPTCGALHENNLIHRFSLAEDQDSIKDLLVRLRLNLLAIENNIAFAQKKFSSTNDVIEKKESSLNLKKGAIELNDLIVAKGRERASVAFAEQAGNYDAEIFGLNISIHKIESEIRQITSKTHKKNILGFLNEKLGRFEYILEARPGKKPISSVCPVIKKTGSEFPRSVLAFRFASFQTIFKYGDHAFPIIVDSPNQQAQDDLNMSKVMTLLLEERPEGSQTIIGIEKDFGAGIYKLDAQIFQLNTKWKVLREDEYETAYQAIMPFLLLATSDKPIS